MGERRAQARLCGRDARAPRVAILPLQAPLSEKAKMSAPRLTFSRANLILSSADIRGDDRPPTDALQPTTQASH